MNGRRRSRTSSTARSRTSAMRPQTSYSDKQEAARYFSVADVPEITENEFNLNLPRYVDTFDPEEKIDLADALKDLAEGERQSSLAVTALKSTLALLEGGPE